MIILGHVFLCICLEFPPTTARLDSAYGASYYASVLVAQFMAMQAWRTASRFQIQRIPVSNGKPFDYYSGKDAE